MEHESIVPFHTLESTHTLTLGQVNKFFRSISSAECSLPKFNVELHKFLEQFNLFLQESVEYHYSSSPNTLVERELHQAKNCNFFFTCRFPTLGAKEGTAQWNAFVFSRRMGQAFQEGECDICECIAHQVFLLRQNYEEVGQYEREIKYFKGIIDLIPHWIICATSYRSETKFFYVNGKAEEMLRGSGLSLDDVHDFVALLKIFPQEDRDQLEKTFRECISQSSDFNGRVRFWNEGKYTWGSLRLRVSKNKHGSADHFYATITDVEQEMELERKIAHNTAKSKFLAVMSHEIKTPIACIIGMSELLAETGLDFCQADYTRTIKLCCDELSCLVDNILDYAKLDQGKIQIVVQECDVLELVEDIIRIFRNATKKKRITIKYRFEEGFYRFLMLDAVRLRQIVINLLSNAIKFSYEGSSVLLEFFIVKKEQLAPEFPPKVTIGIRVFDWGIGLSKEFIQTDLFQSFSQADSTTSRKFGGSGLGLAIAKNLVDLMGGEIKCTSLEETEKTTCFSLSIAVDVVEGKLLDTFPKAFLTGGNLNVEAVSIPIYVHSSKGKESWLWCLVQVCRAIGIPENRVRFVQSIPLVVVGVLCCDEEDFQIGQCEQFQKCLVFTEEAPKFFASGVYYMAKPILISDFLSTLFGRSTNQQHENEFKFGQLVVSPTRITSPVYIAITPPPESVVRHSSEPVLSLSGIRVLVAEDNVINQKIIVKMLEKLRVGHLDITSNGLEAFLKFAECAFRQDLRYNVILMDISMPEMDGFACSERIMEFCIKNSLTLPMIVAVSAHADLNEMVSQSKGIRYLLQKPVNVDKLAKLFREIFPQ